jgi:DNA-binding MarR family transcriptional regulator
MTFTVMGNPEGPLVGALLRRPFLAVRERIVQELHGAGYRDIQSAHLAVFQYPGPHGRSPGQVARSAQISKQSLNHLLGQLESGAYLTRGPNPENGRERVIKLTRRGHQVISCIRGTVESVEEEWEAALGPRQYQQLQAALERLNGIVTEAITADHL